MKSPARKKIPSTSLVKNSVSPKPTTGRPDFWLKAKRYLCKTDPVLAAIINAYKGEMLAGRGNAFFSLARAIVGQQISVKAADSVWNKIASGLNSSSGKGIALITPESILEASTEQLRSFGLSGQKVIYLKELSQFFITNANHPWHEKSDEEVMTDLISIKGIGKWSAEMFLMFHLMRPDVFPLGDLGLRKAINKHYGKGKELSLPQMQKLAASWQPYRTVASWYLWRSLDPAPVEY